MEAPLEPDDLEAGGAYLPLRVAGRAAASEQVRPVEEVDQALQATEEEVPREHVLVEAELSARNEHSPDLAQRRGGSGTPQKSQHETAASYSPAAAGSLSEDPSTISIRVGHAPARRVASVRATGSGSTASTYSTPAG
jgi:hypothetical protein